MKFRTRLTLAMLAVVLIATAVGLLASASQVRASYREALHDLFQSGARSVIAVRDAEMGAVKARCRRLASLPRLVAAFEGENLEDLYLTADDELREFAARLYLSEGSVMTGESSKKKVRWEFVLSPSPTGRPSRFRPITKSE